MQVLEREIQFDEIGGGVVDKNINVVSDRAGVIEKEIHAADQNVFDAVLIQRVEDMLGIHAARPRR